MDTKVFYEADTNIERIKDRTIAIIGYGAQGRAHAQNLRDSGCKVVIGQRPGGQGHADAIADGFQPMSIADAAKQANVINVLLPDEVHGEIFNEIIVPNISDGDIVMTCHGFSFHYNLIRQNENYDRLLVAPKGQGHMVRGEYLSGGGVPCLIAVDEESKPDTFELGLAYAAALGGAKAGILQTTIAAETETDLFGEQAVLCGGVTNLVLAGYDTLVNAGYQSELAYFECLHELKIIVDLLHTSGMDKMRSAISNTAEYGDYVTGEQVIDDHVRANMKKVLDDIQSGAFAKRFMQQHYDGDQELADLRKKHSERPIEKIGAKLRSMMPWLK
jgi:ketol-acid reductoisomerase